MGKYGRVWKAYKKCEIIFEQLHIFSLKSTKYRTDSIIYRYFYVNIEFYFEISKKSITYRTRNCWYRPSLASIVIQGCDSRPTFTNSATRDGKFDSKMSQIGPKWETSSPLRNDILEPYHDTLKHTIQNVLDYKYYTFWD